MKLPLRCTLDGHIFGRSQILADYIVRSFLFAVLLLLDGRFFEALHSAPIEVYFRTGTCFKEVNIFRFWPIP